MTCDEIRGQISNKTLNIANEMKDKERQTIGITMGDAAGIGPEITLKAISAADMLRICRPILIGDLPTLKRTAKDNGLDVELVPFEHDAVNNTGIEVYDLANLPAQFEIGCDTELTGRASAENIEAAVELCQNGRVDAIATAPISKKAISLAGFDYPGHTEFLAKLTGVEDFAMSFFAGLLHVVLLSTHISLRSAIDNVKKQNLVDLIRFTDVHLGRLIGKRPVIAVAGLNPHASEHGMFGYEERDEITPAINECRNDHKIDVSGPYAPDTIFLRGYKGEFDAVVACYHDQATIAVKSLSFGSAVNVTLGLPIIRTSVDHGTAFDIAGNGTADASSMKAAIILAAELASINKRVWQTS